MSTLLEILAAILTFILRKSFRAPDPIQKAQQEAFNAKTEEARVMEAPDRPESRTNDILLQHDERGD